MIIKLEFCFFSHIISLTFNVKEEGFFFFILVFFFFFLLTDCLLDRLVPSPPLCSQQNLNKNPLFLSVSPS